MNTPVRTHVTLPEETVARLGCCLSNDDGEAITAVIDDWLRREHAQEVLAKWAGFVKAEDHPEWATDEDVYIWVRALKARERNPWDAIRPVLPGDAVDEGE